MSKRSIGKKLVLGVAIAVLCAAGLSSSSRAGTETVVVKIENFTFDPPALSVKPGTTVTWENDDDIPHSVVEEKAAFHSKPLDTGEKFSMTFANVGDVIYFCGLHPYMKGKITVAP